MTTFIFRILSDQRQWKTKDTVPTLQPIKSPNQTAKGVE